MSDSILGAEGGASSAEGTSAPAGTPAPIGETFTPPEWAKGLTVDPEILKSPAFKNFNSLDDVIKSHYHAQKLIGAEKVAIPTKASTPEEWKAFYQKGGLPPSLEEYKPELPASIDNEEFKKNLISKAYELNVRPDQLQAIVSEMEANNEKIVNDYQESQKQEKIQTAEALKKEWGGDYQRNLLQAQRVIQHFGGDETLKEVLESPLSNDGSFLRLMAKIGGKLVKEDTFSQDVVQHFGTSREDAQKEINKMMGDFSGPYYDSGHAAHKDAIAKMLRFREILTEKA